jgi:hypothetical protein
MQPELVRFVEFLNRNRIRATYKAVGGAAGIPAQSVGAFLGERCPMASWVVSDSTGEPTGYAEHQKHPDLHSKAEIIDSADELIRRMKREPR